MTAISYMPKAPVGPQQSTPRGEPWTYDEIDWLKKNYHKYQIKQMPDHLPNRTAEAIRQKAVHLGMKKKRAMVSFPIEDVSDFHLGYFVGLIEGEGTVTIESVKYKLTSCTTPVMQYTPVITISNTNLRLLENLQSGIQSGSIQKAVRQIGRKQAYAFRIRGRMPVYSVLERVLPHLIAKKQVAIAVMRFIQTKDASIVNEIRALNRRTREEGYTANYAIFGPETGENIS